MKEFESLGRIIERNSKLEKDINNKIARIYNGLRATLLDSREITADVKIILIKK